MDDFFDEQYADELDALNSQDVYDDTPKPKRSLNFTTPKGKSNQESEQKHGSSTPLRSPLATLRECGSTKKKRGRDASNLDQSDSELEYEDEDLNDTAPVAKRSKLDDEQLDEDELWGDDLPDLKVKGKGLHDNKVKGWDAVEEVEDPELSRDQLVMEKILEQRNKRTVPELTVNREAARHDRLFNEYDFERARVFKRIPATNYLPTTGTDGSRVYMQLKEDAELEEQFKCFNQSLHGTSLLSVPIATLREQLEEERRTTLLMETERLSDEVHRQLDEDPGYMDEDEEEDKENMAPVPEPTAGCQKQLWVEKYAPHRYTDLLSEESINRSLLHWLKLWDYVVFDKEVVVKNNEKKKKEDTKKFKKKNQPEVLEDLDKYKRPLQKVALLCGPPGLGKTTLAHIVARHAGYNVVEMNASDDRSADVFKTRIEAATQMKAVLGADPRPNCLVIDEIDGAPQAAINILLNLMKKIEGSEEKTSKKKKKKEEGDILRRPIICICNDQYVPALRQLRQQAMLLNFPQTEPAKLAGRLYEVVRFERLKSDMNTLLALCEKTENDIRSCLNTLQFIQRQCKELNMKSIQSMTLGQKDSHKSLFSVWYEVLTLPRPKRQKFVNLQEANVKDLVLNTSPSARYKHVLSVVQAAGENEKLTQGLFENYLECKFKDPYMDGVSMATDWLCHTDLMTQYIQHMQDYRLMPYLPYTAVLFHFLFASNMPPRIQYPHSQAECKLKRTKTENLVASMMADMVPGTRKFLNVPVVVMEILPPLMDIIQPTFRPVNTQLYSAREKQDLAHLVSIMIAYNMTYQQEKTLEGQYTYLLEPHMDEVVKFTGMKQHRQLSYASKQLVAREIELEKMRRSEQARAPKYESDVSQTVSGDKPTDGSKTPQVPSHLQRLSAKPLGKEEETVIRDFFGRVIKRTTPEAKQNKTGTGEPTKKVNLLATDIWFHFQEGYSNAVRRNVKVKDFF